MKAFNKRGVLVVAWAVGIAGAGCSSATQSVPPLPAGASGGFEATLSRGLQPDLASVEFHRGITHGATPHGITQAGNFTYFTESGVDKIARITATGVVKEFPVTAGTGPQNIVLGPDGNLWYTEATDAVGRMTPQGVVSDFPVGNEAYGPFDITLGSDGNMWFTFRSPES